MTDYTDDSIFPTPGLLPEVDAIRKRKLDEQQARVDANQAVGRLLRDYAPGGPTGPLFIRDLAGPAKEIVTPATAAFEGECASGASLACEGYGFLRVLPESMLPGSKRESMIQCVACYEASADAYIRKLHHYTGESAPTEKSATSWDDPAVTAALPILPTPDQVRNLTSEGAVALTSAMNASRPMFGVGDAVRYYAPPDSSGVFSTVYIVEAIEWRDGEWVFRSRGGLAQAWRLCSRYVKVGK